MELPPFAKGADQTRLRILGTITATTHLGSKPYRWRFAVIAGLRHRIIMGADLLAYSHAVLDLANRRIFVGRHAPEALELRNGEEMVVGAVAAFKEGDFTVHAVGVTVHAVGALTAAPGDINHVRIEVQPQPPPGTYMVEWGGVDMSGVAGQSGLVVDGIFNIGPGSPQPHVRAINLHDNKPLVIEKGRPSRRKPCVMPSPSGTATPRNARPSASTRCRPGPWPSRARPWCASASTAFRQTGGATHASTAASPARAASSSPRTCRPWRPASPTRCRCA